MSYQPPVIYRPVTLRPGYAAPLLDIAQALVSPYSPPDVSESRVLDDRYSIPDLSARVTAYTPYTPPRIGRSLLLECPYTPPALSHPVELTNGIDTGPGVPDVEGVLQADLPAPVLGLVFIARGSQDTEYHPPKIYDSVVLDTLYRKPELADPVVLCRGEEPDDTAYGQLVATLPQPTPPELSASASAVSVASGIASSALPAPQSLSMTLAGEYSQILELPDADGARVNAAHRNTMAKTATPMELLEQDADQIRVRARFLQEHGIPVNVMASIPSAEAVRLQRETWQYHQHGIPVSSMADAGHSEAVRTRFSIRTMHAHGLPLSNGADLNHAERIRVRNSVRMAEQQAIPVALQLGVGHHNAWPTGTRLEIRWQHGEKPAPGYWWPVYQPPGLKTVIDCTGDYTPRPIRCPIILGAGYPVQPPCPIEPGDQTIIVPVREVYRVINTLTLTEIDGTTVPAEEFSASIDADSWTWSWSARIPASALSQVRPDSSTRVELIATINGEPLRVLVESIQRERRFGEGWLTISGRGRAAFLADPLAPVVQYTNATAMTAQQALNDALKLNGVSLGWTLEWQIDDWQIPAGIWSHCGTWMDAAKRIAEAGGAYVQSHDTDQVLKILPRYPVAPWNWNTATPDIQLPEDVVEVEGIEWEEKADYNSVWVHGGDQGRADRIIIGSTGGTNPAPTIVDELATDPVMTRQRGLALLGDTGKQATISLKLPVLPETGLIRPGKMVEYLEQGNTRRGLVRSLSISHRRPELWQTIGVETHE